MVNNNIEKQKVHIKSLIKKSQREANSKFEDKLENAQEVFLLSNKLDFIEGEIEALTNLKQLYIDVSEYEKASEHCDTLLEMCKKMETELNVLEHLIKKDYRSGNLVT
jgi:DNA-binding SARP family transcriptional activator